MMTKDKYNKLKAEWKKLWKRRSTNPNTYTPGGCSACQVMRDTVGGGWRGGLPITTLCEGACPIDYSYLLGSPHSCQNPTSWYMSWRICNGDNMKLKYAKDVLERTKWLTYNQYIAKTVKFAVATLPLKDVEVSNGI